MDKIKKFELAMELATFSVEHGIYLKKLDDSCLRLPIVYCLVERNGRTNSDIETAVVKYKEIYMSKLGSTDIKIRYKVIE